MGDGDLREKLGGRRAHNHELPLARSAQPTEICVHAGIKQGLQRKPTVVRILPAPVGREALGFGFERGEEA